MGDAAGVVSVSCSLPEAMVQVPEIESAGTAPHAIDDLRARKPEV